MRAPAYRTDGFERSVVSIDGIDTVIYAAGTGPTVLFLHGGGTFMGFEWLRELAADFCVLHPHHPNFGESGAADFTTTTDYAEHYARVLGTLGVARVHLAGASMGAAIAAELAARNQALIDRLALITPAGLISPSVPPPDFTGVPPEDVPAYFVRDRAFIEPYWPRDPDPEFAALLARERAAAAQLRDFTPAGDARTRALAQQITAPTLLLWGQADRVLRVGLLDEWRRELPAATVHVVAAGGHMLLEEFSEARAALKAFLLSRN